MEKTHWNIEVNTMCPHKATAFCCVSHLFMSSIDECGVSSNPLLCLRRNPACCSGRSFHFAVSVQSKKKQQINWWNLQQLFSGGSQEREQGLKECVRSESDVLMNTNWRQLCLIRLNYFHPPGFETFSVSSAGFSLLVFTVERKVKYKQEHNCLATFSMICITSKK